MSIDHEPRPELPQKPSRDSLPAVELLLKSDESASIWPPEVANNPEFHEQARERSRLNERLDAVIKRLPRPDIALEDAVAQGLVTEDQVADVFTSLSELLKDGSEYQRLALYLPFEFLPSASSTFQTKRLTSEAAHMRDAYMSAWGRLLSVQDVRANFVDGDVLEVDKRDGDLPRVVKAAHLIPKLIERGLLSVDDVFFLLEKNSDEILLASVADTIPVLVDMKLLDEPAFARLASLGVASVDEKIREAKILKRECVQPSSLSFTALEKKLHERFREIDAGSSAFHGMTQKRVDWLKGESKRKAMQTIGEIVNAKMLAGGIDNEAKAYVVRSEASSAIQQAFVEGVRSAIETIAHSDEAQARSVYDAVADVLVALWRRDDAGVHDALTRCFVRLHGMKVVTDDELATLHIALPALAGPFSRNLEKMHSEMRDMKTLVDRLEKDPLLASSVYPAMLVFGSRLKGYGAANADLDVAVFVRPGVDAVHKDELREHLRAAFKHDKIQGDAVEFWLTNDDGTLRVQDRQEYDAHVGESHWTHILFGAAWEGDAKAIYELRRTVLAPYFKDDGRELFARPARRLYLEEMERDVLQYRLMHKGYARYMPSFGGMKTPHANSIDGASTFWDSGYRQTATKLFASNVFLPRLKE